MTLKINERGGGRVSIPEGDGLKGEIRMMGWDPGAEFVEGSSAAYPVASIVRDFGKSFPKGTRVRANHDGVCEAGGDIRRIIAKTIGKPVHKEDHEMGPGMYAPVIFSEEASPMVRQFADVVGMSISSAVELAYEKNAEGEVVLDDDDRPVVKRHESGLPIVERFLTMEEYPYNSVDVVEAPGADGRIVALALEAAREVVEGTTIRHAAEFVKGTIKTPRESVEEASDGTPSRMNKEDDMDDAERRAIATEAAQAAVEAYAAAHPATPATEQPTLGQMAESVAKAGLTEAGRAGVYERVENGTDLEVAIATEKAREDSIRAALATPAKESTPVVAAPLVAVEAFGYTEDEGDGTPSVAATIESFERQLELEG